MDARVTPQIDAEDEFVSEVDWLPDFWNFLVGLDRGDLIAELIQNDLDQGATRTIISFEKDLLTCEGNGRPVDPDGWRRLRSIRGAGHLVPAKRGKIGVKNHGLKAAFTIGDEIQLLSDGQAITQTLYRHGRKKPPFPGASSAPRPDPEAPAKGCRIVIRYRKKSIEPREGEAIVLGPVGAPDIDALFRSACANTAEQFAGIVSPEIAPRYEVVLRHWRLGEASFVFSCTKPREASKGIELFRRRCEISGSAPSLPAGLHEQAARRLLPLKGRLRERVPDFYRCENRYFVEVSWSVDGRGKPQPGTGRFRYPIGYPGSSREAQTGHGLYFNAPIVSDTERHGPARNDATFSDLVEVCEKLAVDALARCTVPEWGPDALSPLIPLAGLEGADDTVRRLLAALIRRNAIPTLNWQQAITLLVSGKNRKALPGASRVQRRERAAETRKYKFVVPIPSWEEDRIHPALAVLCPPSERQLDPRLDPRIIALLDDNGTEGFTESFITFDENDALSRINGSGNKYFDAFNDPETAFADPLLARATLDFINEAITHNACDDEESLREALLLPDRRGLPVPFEALYISAPLPSDIPGLEIPPILHESLAAHPLLRRAKWRRKIYTMAHFLEGDALEEADEQTRNRFWTWLCRHERHIKQRERPRLAALPIWPDSNGQLWELSALCEPRSKHIARILGDSIRRPHERVRKSRLTTSGNKHRPLIRRLPSADEISGWLRACVAPFAVGASADQATAAGLRSFEADLADLLSDPGVARMLRAVEVDLPAIAQDGSIRRREDLVMSGAHLDRLALPARYLLKSKAYAATLDKLSPSRAEPTPGMLIAAFEEDPGNFGALHARLSRLLALTEPSDRHRQQLAAMPILPVHGRPQAPRDLAFVSPAGDYWGDWKIRVQAKELTQDDQRRYRQAGVTSGTPTDETSRAFLQWLSEQDASVIERHMTCVLRHILHRQHGPASWASTFTDAPFIPAKGKAGLRLVSLRMAHRRPIFLADAGDIGDAIIKSDPGILIIIDHVREVTEPVSGLLRQMGARSLREALGDPARVTASGNVTDAATAFLERFESLRSKRFRRTFSKRLSELRVELDVMRRDWYDRLSKVVSIRCADDVKACFSFRNRSYWIPAEAAFDPASGTFWIKQTGSVRSSSFYEAIAAQLVFKPATRPVDLMALERALSLEINDPSFGQPATAAAGLQQEPSADDGSSPEGGQEDDDQDGPSEALFGHSPFEPDPARNVPRPRPIQTAQPKTPRTRNDGKLGNDPDTPGSGHKPTPALERAHVEELKGHHYASHCQICLCKRTPEELAPAGSYVEWAEVRRRVVEAHHLDLKSAIGARHAGNLVLLCKLHHDNYGRRLTRAAVTAALKGRTRKKTLSFRHDGGSVSDLEGRTVKIAISDTGASVTLFFTDDHIQYWLSQA